MTDFGPWILILDPLRAVSAVAGFYVVLDAMCQLCGYCGSVSRRIVKLYGGPRHALAHPIEAFRLAMFMQDVPARPVVINISALFFGVFGISAGLSTFLSTRLDVFAQGNVLYNATLSLGWFSAAVALVAYAVSRSKNPALSMLAYVAFWAAALVAVWVDYGV